MARTNIAVRTAVLAAFAASAACDTELSAPRTLLGCDPDQRCANGYRCAHTELGAVCLDEQQWAARCADGEACNGRDDDCDGETDEALADVVSGTDEGECAVRIERCQNGALAVIDPGVDPVEEACNGRDDDCDGETDEHVPLRITGSPTGECRVTVSECSDGVYVTVITGVPPSAEICNGRNDDCDGVTDEDFAFLGTACSVGIGACATSGVYRCSDDGSVAECAAAPGNPGAEVCDGLDNNCDGVPDEIFVELGTACSVGIGACLADGMRVCRRDGLGTACDAMPAEPSSETCNGVDDDCNGVIDNGIPSCCVPGTTRACGSDIGECMMGTQTCAPERAWGACSGIAPSDDSCDGRDNDCDGEADEGLAGCCGALGGTIPCSVGRGACVSGVQTCGDDGLWSACSGILPSDDVCNGRDDDCDGGADEDFPDFGDDCSVGVGACAAAGVRVCAGDGLGTTCGVTAGTPSDETCNLVDDDCDGEVDDGLVTYSGTDVGECQQGIERCFDGAWVVVQERRDSVAETCDGRDEDCDGIADDEAPDCCSIGEVRTCGLSVGRCTVGSQTCGQDFRWSACSGRGPQSERCDGLDNDCNGVADDPWRLQLAMACESGIGACARNGTWACNSNPSAQEERVGVVCDATAEMPGVESCDGIDNDCDGSVDEVADVPPVIEGSSIGRCRPRVLACIDGEMSEIQAAVGPSPEVCNGLDDDCSGAADNDLASVPCYEGPIGTDGVGVCHEGVTACSGGNVRCMTQVLPSPETCDNLDNDCDGVTDGSLDGDGNAIALAQPCYSGPPGTLGIGECRAGTTTCSDGTWGSCIEQVTPNACGGCGAMPLRGQPESLCGGCGTWVCDGTDAVVCEDPCPSRSCRALFDTGGITESGVYTITPGVPVSGDLSVYCDMTTGDGGWTLILAYAHSAGANVPLVIGTAPTDPENGYSHMSTEQLQSLGFSELRFYCETSAHERKMHFKTSVVGALDYMRGIGSNSVAFWSDGFTTLADHSAILPGQADSILNAAIDMRLTDHTFFQWGIAHWNIRAQDSRWECDDSASTGNATAHRNWIR